jgi:hypothetical protein
MTKVQRPRPDDYKIIFKALWLLDVSDIERQIIGWFASLQSRKYSWRSHEGSPYWRGLALEMGRSELMVRRGLQRLRRRGWLSQVREDEHGHHWSHLTIEFTRASYQALEHQQVRHWCGHNMWSKLTEERGHDPTELAEKLLTAALSLTTPKRKDRRVVRVAYYLMETGEIPDGDF